MIVKSFSKYSEDLCVKVEYSLPYGTLKRQRIHYKISVSVGEQWGSLCASTEIHEQLKQ